MNTIGAIIYVKGKPSKAVLGHDPRLNATLQIPALEALQKMVNSALVDGVVIGVNSSYRSHDQQIYQYNRRMSGGKIDPKKVKEFGPAAKPGYSLHQSGLAVDLSKNSWDWLKANAEKFGWFATVASEPWHYEYKGVKAEKPKDKKKKSNGWGELAVLGGILGAGLIAFASVNEVNDDPIDDA